MAQPGGSGQSDTLKAASRWYQSKRVPLYIVVGGTILSAVYFFRSRSSHPGVETGSGRGDPLHEERKGFAAEGHAYKESPGRAMSRDFGLHQGQSSDGIFPNAAIAKKLGKVMGDDFANKDEKKDEKK